MKEFCLALLNAINYYYPIRGPRKSELYIVGALRFGGDLYAFMVDSNRGTFRRMDKTGTDKWFDIAGTQRKYTAIIHNGKRYEKEPTINFEST